jgi:ATP-dependent Lhr-like helicase
VAEVLAQLSGYPAPVAAWEEELLPARLGPTLASELDLDLRRHDILWVGTGPARCTFVATADLDLVRPPDLAELARVTEVLPSRAGRFTLADLAQAHQEPSSAIAAKLWQLAWDGLVTNDDLTALRQGVASGFVASEPPPPPPRRPRRRGFARWRTERPFAGNWLAVPWPEPPEDPLDEEELCRERARLLLARYGILFRELCERELPALAWSRLFRALRLLELSGEVVTGELVAGPAGPQFALPEAATLLERVADEPASVWLSALDPASPCGLALPGLEPRWPRRVPGNHGVIDGERLVLTSESHGRRVWIGVPADHPRLPQYLDLFAHLLGRERAPRRSLTLEQINGERASTSPYLEAFAARFAVDRTARTLHLGRRY